MSIIGFYYVQTMLTEMGWPRKLGMFKGEGYETHLVDASIDQMVDFGAAIGAGRPTLALHIIAEMFRDRDWNSAEGPNVKKFAFDQAFAGARSPVDAVKPVRLSESFGRTMATKDLQDGRVRSVLEQTLLFALLWGLRNGVAYERWYTARAAEHAALLPEMQAAGLKVGPPIPLADFYEACEETLGEYQEHMGQLADIPPRLLADAKALGWL